MKRGCLPEYAYDDNPLLIIHVLIMADQMYTAKYLLPYSHLGNPALEVRCEMLMSWQRPTKGTLDYEDETCRQILHRVPSSIIPMRSQSKI